MTEPVPISQAPRLTGAELRQRTLEEGKAQGRAEWEPYLAQAVAQAATALKTGHAEELARRDRLEERHITAVRSSARWFGLFLGMVPGLIMGLAIGAAALAYGLQQGWYGYIAANAMERRGGPEVAPLVIRDPDEQDITPQPGGYARGREPAGARP